MVVEVGVVEAGYMEVMKEAVVWVEDKKEEVGEPVAYQMVYLVDIKEEEVKVEVVAEV